MDRCWCGRGAQEQGQVSRSNAKVNGYVSSGAIWRIGSEPMIITARWIGVELEKGHGQSSKSEGQVAPPRR